MTLQIERVGFTTLQDLGRPGWAHLGVPHSGAADRGAHRLANRLAGNSPTAATLETSGGLVVRALRDLTVVVTGADCDAFVDESPLPRCRATGVTAGQRVRIERIRSGVRSYLAVAGGIESVMLLGSASHDTLSGIVPQRLDGDGVSHTADGTSTQLPIGERFESPQSLDTPIGPTRGQPLRMATGPHAALLSSAVIDSVVRQTWTVSEVSNRVGVRLVGATIAATALGQLDSLALVRGAVQLTPSGELVVMLADHPTTGGYPVVAVMLDEFVDQLAQCPAGNRVNLRLDD
jgi:biotin-dependent carboxylase-like uncharacterized protein